jgi:beta-ureidopropionase / N-carbamoyl-L-amino-acid hydrolase
MTFADLWEDLEPYGRTGSGYRRYTWTRSDDQCRKWFTDQAKLRGLAVETDRNGNIWAWWDVAPGAERRHAVVTGSHLDSVPDGGAFDGPLGVVSALAAIDLLRDRGVTPRRPVAVTVFVEEEGARFGLACLGSRLLTGVVDPDQARALTDDAGVSYADAMAEAGLDPAGIGPDEDLLGSIDAFVELHVEQGRALAVMDTDGRPAEGREAEGMGPQRYAIGLAEGIWPHGRWRLDFTGLQDHAGTARFPDRKDPMLPFAATVLAARKAATERGALATFGKVKAEPGGVNGVSAAVHAWLDARAADEETLTETVTTVRSEGERVSAEHGVTMSMRQESATPVVRFDPRLRERISAALVRAGLAGTGLAGTGPGGVPVLPTGAGHDAGVFAARLPTAMLFVRNPTGVSHSPAEHAEMADCEAGVRALAVVLEDLACTDQVGT